MFVRKINDVIYEHPFEMLLALEGTKSFLLESLSHERKNGKFSYFGKGEYKEFFIENEKVYEKSDNKKIQIESSILDVLQKKLDAEIDSSCPFSFNGGFIGYFGYDFIRHIECIGERKKRLNKSKDAHLFYVDAFFVWDHERNEVYYVSERNEDIPFLKRDFIKLRSDEREGMQIRYNYSKQEFEGMVKKAKKHIEVGDAFQIVLSQSFIVTTNRTSEELYHTLRQKNPSPYMYYLEFGDYQILGSSPESLVKVEDGKVYANPIAGTRKRGKNEEEDGEFSIDLLADEKELAEHYMLVDLGRNDIGAVSKRGTVHVRRFAEIEYFPHVIHLVSEVVGELEKHSLEALRKCLPAGTVSGAPKIRAMQIINDLEKYERGFYGGAVGYFAKNGNLDCALTIRTMLKESEHIYIQAGAGIVYDSIPENEFEETLHKAKGLLEVFI